MSVHRQLHRVDPLLPKNGRLGRKGECRCGRSSSSGDGIRDVYTGPVCFSLFVVQLEVVDAAVL